MLAFCVVPFAVLGRRKYKQRQGSCWNVLSEPMFRLLASSRKGVDVEFSRSFLHHYPNQYPAENPCRNIGRPPRSLSTDAFPVDENSVYNCVGDGFGTIAISSGPYLEGFQHQASCPDDVRTLTSHTFDILCICVSFYDVQRRKVSSSVPQPM